MSFVQHDLRSTLALDALESTYLLSYLLQPQTRWIIAWRVSGEGGVSVKPHDVTGINILATRRTLLILTFISRADKTTDPGFAGGNARLSEFPTRAR